MFARTERLLLRPGWAEDAPALARAIADEQIVRNLATAPWPYRLARRRGLPRRSRAIRRCRRFLIIERTDGAPRLVGACGLGRRPSGAVELGYWIAPAHWGRGFATEAGRALIEIATDARACRGSKPRTSSTIRPRAGCWRSSASGRPASARHGTAALAAAEAHGRLYRLSLASRGEVDAMAAWLPRPRRRDLPRRGSACASRRPAS